ncbi:MAG: glycogen synthase, partial [Deltaproteobacteria bacterium]|nr:glycogen synthase [Deltaproteobacteria bacterium]
EGALPRSRVPIYFLEHDRFFGRAGGFYGDDRGEGYLDNDNRFAFLCRGALELCKALDFLPDVIHVHDWQTAVIPVYLNTIYRDGPLGRAGTLLTIHNMAYQGAFYEGLMDVLDVGWEHFNFLELEFRNLVNLLKGGLYHATLLNAVSPTYAREIQGSEFGCGLEGVARERAGDLHGILNGIDYDEWNPETDPFIAANYSATRLAGKAACKADLQTAFGLPVRPRVPVVGLVGRLVHQKGIDVLAQALPRLLELDLQVVLLGNGEAWAQEHFPKVARENPGRFGCTIGFDNRLAHKIEAGSDFFLMPSRFEPCGLNQLFSLRYGTLPIVRAVGGLNDTVENFDERTGAGTGFKFDDLTPGALFDTVGWAVYSYYNEPKLLKQLITRAMGKRFTWDDSARRYEELYYEAVRRRTGAGA